jgi:hypothetical protein
MCFFKSTEETYLEKTPIISTLERLCCRKYFFQKLTQFSQGNNVLHAEAFIIDCFLWRDTCVSLTLLKRHIWSKESQTPS